MLLGPVDEVRDDQEVTRESHLHDDVELELESLLVVLAREARGGRMLREPLDETVARVRADEAVERVLARHRKRRQEILAEAELEIAAHGKLDRVLDELREIAPERGHRLGCLEVLLDRILARPFRIGEHASGVDAYARLVRLEIVAREEAHVVRRDDREIERLGQRERAIEEDVFVRPVRARRFEIETIRKLRAQTLGAHTRVILAAADHEAADLAVASGERDQARAGRIEPVAADDRAVAVPAFGVGARQEPRQVEISLAVLAEQHQPMRLGALVAIGNPEIAAGDRLDAGRLGRLVELDEREEVALVGQRDGGHAGRDARVHEIADADRRVDQRILAVDVKMDEFRRHEGGTGGSPQRSARYPQRQA